MAREEVDAQARFKFADALARGVGADAAAKLAGYSRMWGYRLRNDKAFMAEVEKRKVELSTTILLNPLGDLKDQAAYAVKRLRELAEKPDEDGAYVAVAACKAILDLARKPIVAAVRQSSDGAQPIKMLPPIEEGKAADEWLKAQG